MKHINILKKIFNLYLINMNINKFYYTISIIIFSAIMIYCWEPIYGRYIDVSITCVGEKNAQSQGTEVWLLSIQNQKVNASLLEKNNGWIRFLTSDAVMAFGGKNESFRYKGVLSGDSIIRLLRHPWSGFVKISVNQQSHIYDLYSQNSSEFSVSSQEFSISKKFLWPNLFANIVKLIFLLFMACLLIKDNQKYTFNDNKIFNNINFYFLAAFLISIYILPCKVFIENNLNPVEQVSFYTNQYLNNTFWKALLTRDGAGYMQPLNIIITYIVLYFSPEKLYQGILSYSTLVVAFFINSLICINCFRKIIYSDIGRMLLVILLNVFILSTEIFGSINIVYGLSIYVMFYILIEKNKLSKFQNTIFLIISCLIIATKGLYIVCIPLIVIHMLYIFKNNNFNFTLPSIHIYFRINRREMLFLLIVCLLSIYNIIGMDVSYGTRKDFHLHNFFDIFIYYINFIYILISKIFSIGPEKTFHPYIIMLCIFLFIIIILKNIEKKSQFYIIYFFVIAHILFSFLSFYVNSVGPDFMKVEGGLNFLQYTTSQNIYQIPLHIINTRRYCISYLLTIVLMYLILHSFIIKEKQKILSILLFIFLLPAYPNQMFPNEETKSEYIGIWQYIHMYIHRDQYLIPSFDSGDGIMHNIVKTNFENCTIDSNISTNNKKSMIVIIIERMTGKSRFPIALEIEEADTKRKTLVYSDYPGWYRYQYFPVYKKISSFRILPLCHFTGEFKAKYLLAHSL